MSFAARLVPLGCLFFLGAPHLSAAEPAWRMLETPRFTVYSQLSDARTRAWAEEFNQFIEELRHMFVAQDAELPPLSVLIFARDRDFTPYKGLRPDGKAPRNIAGFFSRREAWSIVGLQGGDATAELRELIFHEGVHWYMSAIPGEFPVWLEEGVAEVFSTFQRGKDKVTWGAAIPNHVQWLAGEGLMPLERLLFVDRQSPLFNEAERSGLFYAQSWLFTHYLIFGERKGPRNAIDLYLQALVRGTAVDAAFREAFGGSFADLDAELRRYLRAGRFYTPTRPLSAPALDGLTVAAAPEHLVEAQRARLAVTSRRYEVAAAHVTRALALAPQHPAGYEAQAVLEYERKAPERARAAAEAAEKLGSQDAGTLFLLAYLRAKEEAARGGLWGQPAREIAQLYHRVLHKCPSMEQAYINLAALFGGDEKVGAADVALLKQGLQRFPHSGELVLGLAQIVAKAGDRAQARQMLEAARRRGLPGDYGRWADELEERWTYEEYTARIEAHLQKMEYGAALALHDELLPQIKNVQMRGNLIRMRRSIAVQDVMQQAEAAAQEGRFDTARVHYEQALASGDLPATQRRMVEERLARLPAAAPATPATP